MMKSGTAIGAVSSSIMKRVQEPHLDSRMDMIGYKCSRCGNIGMSGAITFKGVVMHCTCGHMWWSSRKLSVESSEDFELRKLLAAQAAKEAANRIVRSMKEDVERIMTELEIDDILEAAGIDTERE
jgi:DNA-directed RNA polymerase subunit RPC12/RpoP